ncbi:protein of unknown function [Methylocaldum szegediense]|uniref:Uncharacterized protein n=1 Tax=Methylocaldum szegediense TaxID=73780 RepID=A0ABN8X161_9GAMM|nr:protein of unknown function [Methylocaldum szegediense]
MVRHIAGLMCILAGNFFRVRVFPRPSLDLGLRTGASKKPGLHKKWEMKTL